MLKLLNVIQIFNFHIFLVDFSFDFKHVALFYFDELLGLLYMIKISSFQNNLNHSKTPLITLDMSQTIHEYLV